MSSPSLSRPYRARLERLRAALRLAGLDAFVVTHLPNVRYLTGLSATAGVVVVTPAACTLAVDFRYRTAAAQALAGLEAGDSRDHRDRSGANVRLEMIEASFDEWLVRHLEAIAAARIGIEAAVMPVSQFNRLSASLAAGAAIPPVPPRGVPALVATERVVEALRLVKDEAEIATLREAGRRLSRVAHRLPALVRAGRTEQAIAGEIDAALREEGFERPAFETIVASGPNGALPHARPGPRVLQAGEGVVLDFGGVYDGYCVDLTRTLRLGAQPAELRRLFAAVAEAHAAALAAVRPGALPGEIDGAARRALEAHGLGEAFGHATGHGLGLEVHEEPRIGRPVAGRTETPVAAGMVFTIEPGAYVAGLGGVRIEDDVLVTGDGCELLTRVPVGLEAPGQAGPA